MSAHVLAVMDKLAERIVHTSIEGARTQISEELEQARAAVAELIQAAQDVVQIIPATCLNDEKWLNNLRDALDKAQE
jgi:hypothetical protein